MRGITAGIDLSVGSILALSMSVMAMLAIKLGVNPFLAMLVGLLIGLGMGMVNGLLLTRLHLPHPFIATLGTMNIARGLALIITGAAPISGFDRAGAPEVLWLGAGTVGPIPVAIIVVMIVYAIFHVLLSNTALGRGRTNSGYPTAATGAELDAIAAVIIGGASFAGGAGTVWGTAIGVLLIAVLRNGLVLLKVPTEWQVVAIGVVIIGAVYVDVLRQRARR